MIELILKLFFSELVLPLALELAMRRETDPAFRAESDTIYGELKNAKTTADRRAASKKLYELQKKYSS